MANTEHLKFISHIRQQLDMDYTLRKLEMLEAENRELHARIMALEVPTTCTSQEHTSIINEYGSEVSDKIFIVPETTQRIPNI